MSDTLLIALISLASSVTTAIITAIIGPLVVKFIERSSAHSATSATVPVTRPWWQFALLGAVIGALVAVVPLVLYTYFNRDAATQPIRTQTVAYYTFEQPVDLKLWASGDGASSNQQIELRDPGFTGRRALSFSAPISSTEEFDLHAIHVLDNVPQPPRFQANAIVARVYWPAYTGVRITYAVLCVRPDGGEYICEGLPQTPGRWQTIAFNLRENATTDLLGLAVLARFEKTSSEAPLTMQFLIDDLEIWSERSLVSRPQE
ncbi:hypothetical protein [Candidatus Chloroploca asiatica]|uniref:Uncharacterized protein n=1 Tax=Candidatus Chloroploca asiatica TaxID=1506545 RepID=A0A2H3L9J8_9CHLR|nr:hypothetical protein [Candidatus Chloroploca asiatica]PDV98998.1 hypothetical protein A9Q02_14205 [Candidatus Chloroploca asiatica]